VGSSNTVKVTSYYSIFKQAPLWCEVDLKNKEGILIFHSVQAEPEHSGRQFSLIYGAVAQLARAPALQAGCPGFESL
jgi:hypothetical protein